MPAKKKTTEVKAAITPVSLEIKIDKGIPVPVVVSGKGKYPLENLMPGDSFLVACSDANAEKLKASIMGAARRVGKKLSINFPPSNAVKFVALVRPEEKGVRCWRSDAGASNMAVPATEPTTPAEEFVTGEDNGAPQLQVFDE